jgi:tetratricopeptide (TPR) repeat protein
MAELRRPRLETWKEVAAFFGKDERTVKRWEAERGLPVHRLPGAARSRIYAETAELEAWLAGRADPGADAGFVVAAAGAAIAAAPPRRLPVLATAGAAALALAVGVLALAWPQLTTRTMAPPASSQPPSLAAQRLYLAGMDDWSRRTPDSLHRAVDEFTQAIHITPGYAEAYVGLANCYNLLREFTLMPPAQAYPLAKAAAQRALALNGRLASAHAALGFVDAYWDWDVPGARREFQQAIALEPASDLNHHWYATFLSAQGEFPASLAEFQKAEALNPTSLAIRSDHGLVLWEAGRRAEGVAMLQAVERTDPKFLSPHRYLSGIHLAEGRDGDYLREAETAARLTDDRQRLALIDAGRAGLARGGRRGMLQAMLDEELRQYRYGALSAFRVAETYALMGEQDLALAYLQTSIDRREEEAVNMVTDTAFLPLRSLPRYRLLVARIHPVREPSRA